MGCLCNQCRALKYRVKQHTAECLQEQKYGHDDEFTAINKRKEAISSTTKCVDSSPSAEAMPCAINATVRMALKQHNT